MVTYIYALVDPRTDEIRYVGKSDNPERRLFEHLSESKKADNHKDRWIRQLRRNKLVPRVVTIDIVADKEWEKKERGWIAFFRKSGIRLTNSTDGGNGGRKVSEGTRLKMSLAQRGKKVSVETREKLRLANTGKKMSAEARTKMSESRKNRVIGPETRKLLSLAAKGNKRCLGRKLNEETKKKIGAASKGNKNTAGRRLTTEQKTKISIGNRGKRSKFTEQDIIEIRRQVKAGIRQSDLADQHNVSRSTINLIIKGKNFAWVEFP